MLLRFAGEGQSQIVFRRDFVYAVGRQSLKDRTGGGDFFVDFGHHRDLSDAILASNTGKAAALAGIDDLRKRNLRTLGTAQIKRVERTVADHIARKLHSDRHLFVAAREAFRNRTLERVSNLPSDRLRIETKRPTFGGYFDNRLKLANGRLRWN